MLTDITFWNTSSETTLNYTFEAYSNYTHTIQYRNLGQQLLSIRLYSNPVSIWHQRQDFKHWILDQCADIGGFILFTFLLFGTPCVAIQWRLYQARVVQDRYRLKFNKVLRGLKERKYKKKAARKEKMLEEEQLDEMDGADEEDADDAEDPEADKVSQTSAERAAARLAR